MQKEINGESLSSRTHYHYFNFTNPTKMNLQKAIVNYKIKISNKKKGLLTPNYSMKSLNPKKPEYEPTVRMIPSLPPSSTNSTKRLHSYECIMSKRLKINKDVDALQRTNRPEVNKILNSKGKIFYSSRDFYKNKMPEKTDAFTSNFKDSYFPLENSFKPHDQYDSDFSPHTFNIIQQGESLNLLLNKKKNNFIFKNGFGFPMYNIEDAFYDLFKTKQNLFRNNAKRTYYLNKRFTSDKNIPIFLPTPVVYNNETNSNSEKKRIVKNSNDIQKLRYFLNEKPQMKKILIKEFLIRNKVYNEDYYSKEKIENFAKYIKSNDVEIDYRKPISDIIKEGMEYFPKGEIKKDNKDEIIMPIFSKSTSNIFDYKRKNKKRKSDRIDNYKLISNLNEQKKLYQSEHSKSDVLLGNLSNEEIWKLEDELSNLNKVNLSNLNGLDKTIRRLYYKEKQKKDDAQPQNIPKKMKKLTEYIVLNHAKAIKEYRADLLHYKINKN